jgi:amino acid adenylation domain-containing protein/FkbM family methyltransferase
LTELSVKRIKSRQGDIGSGKVIVSLPKGTGEQLEKLTLHQRITPAALFYSAWGLLLQRYNNSEDAVFGTTVSGRTAKIQGIEKIVGLLINTIPLRIKAYSHETILSLLYRIDDQLKARQEVEHTSLVKIKEYGGIENQQELFDTIMVIENYPLSSRLKMQNSPFSITSYSMQEMTHYDLTVGIALFDEIELTFTYQRKKFDLDAIRRLTHHFKKIVMGILTHPGTGKEASSLEMITGAEKRELLSDFNDTNMEYPPGKTIHRLFEEQVERTPGSTALIFQDQQLSYQHLNEKANQLVQQLIAKGIRTAAIAAIMAERSMETIIGLLGILKAGGAYLPLDPNYPEERKQYMLKESGARILVSGVSEVSELSEGIEIIDLHRIEFKGDFLTQPTQHTHITQPNLAYVIYTSGSTGKPKGVLVEHHSVVNLALSQKNYYNIDENDRILQFSSLCFDASVEQIFIAFFSGAVLVLVDRNTLLDSRKFEEFISSRSISHLHAVPSFLSNIKVKDTFKLKRVIAGGDVCPVALAKKWSKYCDFYNEYGPTETTVTSIEMMVRAGDVDETSVQLPIGRPINNTAVYIFDKWMKLVPKGAAGELYIGGKGVARGYLNNPELTAEKFLSFFYRSYKSYMTYIPKKIYKTGDLARWLSGGNIEFIGRRDHQVKIRGFRIELGEIESQLLKHNDIKETVVTAKQDETGDDYLCAYIVPRQDIGISVPGLKEYLSGFLPDYMIPTCFAILEKLPLTPIGKVDKKALPEPHPEMISKDNAPRDKVEETLAEIWSQILGIEKKRIGIDSDFFRLGGHSLKAVRLLGHIHKAFNITVPLKVIFDSPTIREMANYLGKSMESPFTGIPSVEETGYYPMSSSQERLFFLYRMDRSTTVYNMTGVMLVQGNIETKKWETIFQNLITRHESLRTSFLMVDDKPVQKIYKDFDFKIEQVEVDDQEGTGGLAPLAIELAANTIEAFIRPFDLAQPPLLRVGLIHTPRPLRGHPSQEGSFADNYILVVDMHHIISDGVSINLLMKEFQALYAGIKLPALRIQYKDYARWQKSKEIRERIKNQQEYWVKVFSDEIPVPDLAADFTRPMIRDFAGGTIDFELAAGTTARLKILALEHSATLFMVLLSIVNILLSKLSSQEDIVIGTPGAGRQHADLQPIIGMFVNTLALRNYPVGEKSFNEFLSEVKVNTIAAFENQDYPFEELIEQLDVERDTGRNPLFDTMFALQNMEIEKIEISQLSLTPYPYQRRISKFDLALTCEELGQKLLFTIEYSTKLYKEETIKRFISYFKRITAETIENPDKKIAGIEIISTREKNRLLYDFNDTRAAYPKYKTIHQLFQEQVERTSDHIAAAEPSPKKYRSHMTHTSYISYLSYLSYRELNRKSNQLARALRKQGISNDAVVGLLMEPCIYMVIGIMGILKAGAAYLPIDLHSPQGRIEFIVNDTAIPVLLCQNSPVKPTVFKGKLLDLYHPSLFSGPSSNPAYTSRPKDLAYVIYTSGSTGRPKGAAVEHSQLVNFVYHMYNRYEGEVDSRDRCLGLTNIMFDVSVWEFFLPLAFGARLVILPRQERFDVSALAEAILLEGITLIYLPPGLLKPISEELAKQHTRLKLNKMLVGVEPIRDQVLEDYMRLNPRMRIINGYGPTETTICATSFNYSSRPPTGEIVPIGVPLSNNQVVLLDPGDHLVPGGTPGELCISGDGVSRGYLNNPELTAEKYPPHPYFKAKRMYRSGDLARWLPEGNIRFIGRRDQQLKIRGYRIELGEIENRLLKHRNIKQALVSVNSDERSGKYLCAYIVPGEPFDISSLREFLSGDLPDYMIPSYFVTLEKIPLTPNGKVDRKAFPVPQIQPGENYTAPRDKIEKKLAEIWSEVLEIEIEKIGIDDNFFHLGGHSLKATQLAAKIQKEMDVTVPLTEIFKTSHIRGLAAYIKKSAPGKYIPIEPVEKKDYYPLSSAQKRLFILQQMDKQGIVYNIPSLWKLEGFIDTEKLQKTFLKLIHRHESLRTSFHLLENEPVQRIHDEVAFKIESYQVEVKVEEERSSVNRKHLGGTMGLAPLAIPATRNPQPATALINSFIRPFDLSQPPLLRVGVIKLPHPPTALRGHPRRGTYYSEEGKEDRYLLGLDMHHIISDGTSVQVLIKDFTALYEDRNLPLPGLQYKDFSRWQSSSQQKASIKKQEQYWLKQFENEIPVLDLPTDFTRPLIQDFSGSTLTFETGQDETLALKSLAQEQRTTLFMALLSIYTIFLSKLGRQEDIVVGIPIAGRRHPGLEPLMGMFVNTLALRNYPLGEKRYNDFLKEVKQNTSTAFENQDYPFEELVERLDIERDIGRNPLFDVMFAMQNLEMETKKIEIGDLHLAPYRYQWRVSRVDLAFICQESKQNLSFAIEYSTKLFKEETIIRFIDYFKKIISSIIEDPGRKISGIEIITGKEKNQILYDFNNTKTEYPKDKTIHELFEEQVKRTPDNIAIVGPSVSVGAIVRAINQSPLHQITYKELNEKSHQPAGILRDNGVLTDDIVAIKIQRSIEMIIAILGILKAGGAYLPIDPEYPEERIKYMLNDSKVKCLIKASNNFSNFNFRGSIEVIFIDEVLNKIGPEGTSSHLHLSPSPVTSLAYIIYTSGSTGKPKGVMIQHDSLINRLHWMQKQYPIDQKDIILQKTPFTFDVSLWEIFWWSITGARVCCLLPGGEKDPQMIIDTIEKHLITIMHFVPSMLNVFLEFVKNNGQVKQVSGLKQIIASGEALTLPMVRQFNDLLYRANGTRLANLYGPTEATVDVSFFDCSPGEPLPRIPIGKPIDNIKLYVLDNHLQPMPVGIAGELCIAGDGLARGYLNRPGLTSERFLSISNRSHRSYISKKIYRTGDLVKWLPDGNIEFLGRIDHQVKIRGFRIELGEIENQLLRYSPVKEAVATLVEDECGTASLAAYVTPDPQYAPAIKQLLTLDRKGRLQDRPRYEYPNGITIFYINRGETDFMYREIFETKSYLKHGITLDEGACIFDVGANIGMFSLFVNDTCKNAKIYAFEPIPPIFELLSLNTSIYCPNTEVFQYGLAGKESEAIFTYYPHASVLSGRFADKSQETTTVKAFIKNGQMESKGAGEKHLSDQDIDELLEERLTGTPFTCKLKSLSQVIKEKGLDKIDLLKIDVEKCEIDVLNGIEEEDWPKIRQLVIEVHDIDSRLEQIIYRLEQRGYRVVVDQDTELKDTDLYNVYATMSREAAAEMVLQQTNRTGLPSGTAADSHWLSPRQLIADIRGFLAESVPEYMVPSYFTLLDRLPLTANGKVDRKALPAPRLAAQIDMYTAPGSTIENQLAQIWSQVLGIEKTKIGIDTNFFELGGHSLKATLLLSKIHQAFQVDISLSEIFTSSTVKKLAAYIKNATKARYISIEPTEKKEYYTTSSAQKRLYVLQQMDAEGIAYNIPSILTLEGKPDIDQLQEVSRKLIQRHESLRTSFHMLDEETVQKIHQNVEFSIEYYDLATEGRRQTIEDRPGTHLSSVIRHLSSEFIRPFDLSHPPLLRVGLIKLKEEEYLLMLDMHHIVSDGTSMMVLVKDFAALYQDKNLPTDSLQHKDFSQWQTSHEQKAFIKKQEQYWLKEFAGEIPLLNLPTDFTRPVIQSFAGSTIKFEIGQKQTGALKSLAHEQDVTFFMILLAIYTIFLAKLGGQEDIVVGTPIGGRRHARLENIIGMFVNTLPLRNYPVGEKRFKEFLKELKENTLAAFENQDYPFGALVEQLYAGRNTGRTPLLDTMFILQNLDFQGLEVPGLKMKPYQYERTTSKFDLTLECNEQEENLSCIVEYSTKLFKVETIQRFTGYLKQIISVVAADPDRKISEIDLLPEQEIKQLVIDFNETAEVFPTGKTIYQLFEDRVDRIPDHTALVFKDKTLTFRHFDEKANQLANYLRQEKGIASCDRIAVLMKRSIDLMLALMGVLKAGGAYVPLDPALPLDRLRVVFNDASISAAVSQQRFHQEFMALLEKYKGLFSLVCTDDPGNGIDKYPEGRSGITGAGNPAYVMYTSGSSGIPKGVLVEHQTIVNTLIWRKNFYGYCPGNVSLQLPPYFFDSSVTDIFTPLSGGARLVLVSESERVDLAVLKKVIPAAGVSHFIAVPAFYNVLLEEIAGYLKGVKMICCAGEHFPDELIKKHFEKLPHVRIVNEYGPTENSVNTTAYELHPDSPRALIGKPISNVNVYILDRYLCLSPIGVTGEMCLAGSGLSRGYLNSPEMTAVKFVFKFYKSYKSYIPKRFYKTGDLGRWSVDGNLEFLGRADTQVKIRGMRIEIGEIENQLMKHGNIKEAVVIARESAASPGGEKFLCAYIVSVHRDPGTISRENLQEYLSRVLPAYMIPSYFVPMDHIPLTPSGKIDRQALPIPKLEVKNDYVPPRDELEKKLVKIWSEVLGRDASHASQLRTSLGITDNFFQLGGHSLKATILISRIHKELNTAVPLVEIFKTPAVRGIAGFIKKQAKILFSSIPPLEAREYFTLSSPQRRLYVVQQLDEQGIAYNTPSMWILEGRMDKNRFENTFSKLIHRHESLRTSIEIINGEPVQRIHKENYKFQITNYKQIPNSKSQITNIVKDFIRPFDLSRAPLLRVGLSQMGKEKYLLLVDMHHIISDGSSINVLIKDFMTLYEGKDPAPLEIQYKDFSGWQNDKKQKEILREQEVYWLEQFKGDIPVLNLPTDYVRPALQSFDGRVSKFEIYKEDTRLLKLLAHEQGATLFMVLVSIYTIFLAKLAGQEDIVVGTPIAGRRHADLEPIIGMFVNTLALRNFPFRTSTFTRFLKETKKRTLNAFENQDYPYENLVENVEARRDTSRNPLFDTAFLLQNVDFPHLEIPGMTLKPYEFETKISKFDLSLYSIESNETIIFSLEYCIKIFKQETINRFVTYFRTIVSNITRNPEAKIEQIEILPGKEKQQILYDFNNTSTSYPKDKTIHALFAARAEKIPDNVALAAPAERKNRTYMTNMTYISYRQLNRESNRLAHLLMQKGITPDTPVGIMLPRSAYMITGILGILKAGGAYLPIDPDYPQKRIDYLLEDSSAKVLVTTNTSAKEVKKLRSLEVKKNLEIVLLDFSTLLPFHPSTLPFPHPHLPPAPDTSLAYIIYTSGSTGKPKGVMAEHQSLVNLCTWHNVYFRVSERDRATQYASIGFDASVWEIFPYLVKGASLYIIAEEIKLDPQQLNACYNKNDITIAFLPTPVYQQFMEHDNRSLRMLLTGGDKLRVFRRQNYTLYNNYGPTENTVVAAAFPVDKEYDNIPIGKPVDNNRIYILNPDYLTVQPIGVTGELCISGDSLARGYLNQPELTSEKFRRAVISHSSLVTASSLKTNDQCPMTNDRLYRTGDLARWLPDGNIQFLGRIDYQVKIRGYRIELGEIEHHVKTHPGIKDAVVIYRNDQGKQYLCAYFMASQTVETGIPLGLELKKYLEGTLPGYMIPASFVKIDKVPLNPNGKLDRKMLPQPLAADSHSAAAYEPPQSGMQKVIAKTWQEVLGREKVGIKDNFFDLGGNSLDLVTVRNKLKEKLEIEIPVVNLFRYPTISSLEQYLTRNQGKQTLQEDPRDHFSLIDEGKALMQQTLTRLDNGD